jgi:ferric-dicitrate binding protein FerR (iron transport regulator)
MPTTKDALIAKYVSGNCSPEEEAMLLAWSRKDKLYARELELAKKSWEDAGHLKKTGLYDADAAWREFLQRKDTPLPKNTTPSSRTFFFRTAAVLVLMLVIGFVIRLGIYETTAPVTEPALVTKPAESPLNDIQVTSIYSADSAVSLVLPDSSRVLLNRYSSLHYTKFYNIDRRAVYLNGEAFFEVVHNDSVPFYVICGEISTKVTGTSFDVKSAGNSKVEVSVVTGTVEVENNKHPGQKIILQQQEKAIFNASTASFTKAKSNTKDLKWKEKKTLKKRIQSFIQKFRKKP